MRKFTRSFFILMIALLMSFNGITTKRRNITIINASTTDPYWNLSGAENAETLEFNKEVTRNINSQNNDAWFKLTTKEDGFLTVTLTVSAPVQIRVYNSDLSSRKIIEINSGKKESEYALDSGTYYIRFCYLFYYDGEDINQDVKVGIKTSFEPANNNEGHDNRTIESAKKISLNEKVNGFFSEGNASDYYKFTIPNEQKITFHLKAEEEVWMSYKDEAHRSGIGGRDIDLDEKNGNQIITSEGFNEIISYGKRNNPVTDTASETLAAGTYYVELRATEDLGRYQFSITADKTTKPTPKPTQEPTSKPVAEKTVTMYRAYNPNSGEHFYTANKKEFDHIVSLGWHNEGVGWIAPQSSKTPVYRLYNKNGGEHHYTTSAAEKKNLLKAGWSDEGIGWYSDDSKRTPLYRQYNPNAFANNHNYSTSKSENDHLVSLGWRAEGIGWYGVSAK